jgi:thiol-disulfide isomerase/thioredoxin
MMLDGPPANRPPHWRFLDTMSALSPLRASRRGLVGRRLALVAAGTLLAALPGRQAARAASPTGKLVESEPKAPPEFSFADAEGKVHTVADFAGKGLVINLWATWCPPCVAEMPALDRAQAALAGEGIVVLALSSDRGGKEKVEPFYRERGIRTLGIWLDPRGTATRTLGARGLPTTVILDRQGRERARLEGAAEWDTPEMLATIRRLVAVEEAPART